MAVVLMASFYDGALVIKKALKRQETSEIEIPHKKMGVMWRMVLCFSLLSNTKKLLDTSHRNETFACINGLRAISMFMIVGGHSCLLAFTGAVGIHNPILVLRMMKELYAQPVFNALYCVDTFFCLTAFLVTHVVLKEGHKLRRFNVLAFYVHRYWRMTPALLLVTFSAMGPVRLLGDGPIWMDSPILRDRECRDGFWKMPIYTQIYNDFEKDMMCLPHTWYLGTEMSLYILTPIVLYPLFLEHWSGPVILATSYVGITVWMGIYSYVEKLETGIGMFSHGIHGMDNFKNIYTKPWGRMHSFLIGMFFGYLWYYRGKNLKLSKKATSALWMTIAVAMLACIFINYPYASRSAKFPPTRLYLALFGPISQSAWSFSIGLIIFLCSSGYGGAVNSILSWKVFAPIGRLSFCAYLVHLQILYHFAGTKRYNLYSDTYLMGLGMVALNAVTLLVAYVLSMLVESPSVAIEQYFLKRVLHRFKKKDKTVKMDKKEMAPFSLLPTDNAMEIVQNA